MVDVFISYSRTNRDIVARLAEGVKAEGYSLWWDEELPPHLSYGDVITEKIGSARAAIVVWSKAAGASEWVRAEADVARNQKKLIQVSVDDSMPPLPFNQIQFASIGDWQGEADHPGWRKVKASLAALCGAREADAGPAAAPPPSRPAPPHPAPAPASAAPAGGRAGWIVAGLLALTIAAGAAFWTMRRSADPSPAPVALPNAPPSQPASTQPASPQRPDRFALPAGVQDPDGYTNLRAGPSAQSAILARVEVGEALTTFRQHGDWWQVRTADGMIGYMHRSRIRLGGGAPAARRSDPPEVLADSSVRPLTEDDLAALDPSQLRIARNEIYARRGRIFADPALRRHFERYSWYSPRSDEVALSPLEQANVRLLQEAEEGAR